MTKSSGKHHLAPDSRKHLFWIFCAALLALIVPAKTHAALFDGLLTSVLGWVVFGINYIIATIFGYAIFIISFFISIVLQLNLNIAKTPIVTSGFSVTLSLANLGFVLAIIVIAIMTILRYETYALKGTLWKLVAAAILVNFSLVICASILNFSDRLTSSFLNAFSSNCQTGTGSALSGLNKYDCFASALAGSFDPQRVFLKGLEGVEPDKIQDSGKNFSAILVVILNLFFPTLFLIVTVIALFGFFIMLLIRYLYLAILMILMPMAWLLWIFPATSGQWSKWWHKFIQWTMFAPVVMFFIYLAVLTMGGTAAVQGTENNSFLQRLAGSGVISSGQINEASTGGVLGVGMFGTVLQMGVMIALVFAGLFMAQSMGIAFADTTLKGATAVTSGFGSWVGRRTRQVGGAALDRLGVRNLAQKLQTTQIGAKGGMLGKVAGWPLRYGAGWLGRGLESATVATREDLVKEAKKRLASKTSQELNNNMSTYPAPDRVAAMQMLFERGDKIDSDKYLNKSDFERLNQGESYKKINKQVRLADENMLEAVSEAVKGNYGALDKAIEGFLPSISKSDISSNKYLNDIFSGKEFMGRSKEEMKILNESLMKQMAIKRPELMSGIIPKLSGSSLENFALSFDLVKKSMPDDKRMEVENRFKTMMTNNIFTPAAETPGAASQQPAPPPPPAAH